MAKAVLKTLTPVHIGSGVSYQHKIEYFTEGNNLYIIDPQKLFKLLKIDDIESWVKSIESGKGAEIKSFLNKHKINYKDVALRTCKVNSKVKDKEKELHEQIYTSIKRFYIPGSSIKGAIKSCLLPFLSKEKKNIIKIDDLKEVKNGKKIWTDKIVDNLIFGNSANTKLTRFIKVGDVYFDGIETKVYYTVALNADKNGWIKNKGIVNLYEAIPENSISNFELKFDEQLLYIVDKYFIDKDEFANFESFKKNFNNIFNIINLQTKNMIDNEINFFRNKNIPDEGKKMLNEFKKILQIIESCRPGEFVLRIGGNSGYNFITYKWFDDLPVFQGSQGKVQYKLLRKEIQKNKSKKDYSNENFWPRTRKIVDDLGTPFGFVKISLLNEINETVIINKEEPKDPPYFTGEIKQGTINVPALVVESGTPNKVKLLIKDKEIVLKLNKYASPLPENTYVYVKIDEFSNKQIKQVSFLRKL